MSEPLHVLMAQEIARLDLCISANLEKGLFEAADYYARRRFDIFREVELLDLSADVTAELTDMRRNRKC